MGHTSLHQSVANCNSRKWQPLGGLSLEHINAILFAPTNYLFVGLQNGVVSKQIEYDSNATLFYTSPTMGATRLHLCDTTQRIRQSFCHSSRHAGLVLMCPLKPTYPV